ncbi:hypothetical protein L3V86_05095 [Thiotrichales bacterium 19S11-10]|nr:hypothetical protein [Thiotrichales bacterium 19S11-10]
MPGENDKQYFDLQGNEFSLRFDDKIKKFILESNPSNNDNDKENISNKLPNDIKEQKHSLIPIQQEMLFYTLRVIGALSKNNRKDNQEKYFNDVYSQVYNVINKDLNEYLDKHPNASVKDINKYIDEKRKDYINLIENLTIQHFIRKYQHFPDKTDIQNYLYYKTAADLDMVIYNPATKIVTEITGPDDQNSSHSKKIALPAVMVMKHYQMDDNGNYNKEGVPIQIQYRVPSLAIPTIDGINRPISEQLTNLFFGHEEQEYITYNLLTSIPILFDANSQEKTARIIFEGIHEYNQSIQNTKKPVCYALNLPINQHTHLLSYDSINETAQEALFMADLAMFNSLKDYLPGPNYQYLLDLNGKYTSFLELTNRPALFYKSKYAEDFQTIAIKLKSQINETVVGAITKKNKLAKTLLKLYATNYHGADSDQMKYQKEMASIIQGMHLSLTQHNLKGCKSANERFSFIENLNELFLAYHNETLEKNIAKLVNNALKEYLQKASPTPKDGYDLAVKLHQINDQYNVYGTGIFPSMLDTGTPKDKTDENGNQKSLAVSGTDTNYYRPRLYRNVFQGNASFEQAHGKMLDRLPDKVDKALANMSSPPPNLLITFPNTGPITAPTLRPGSREF